MKSLATYSLSFILSFVISPVFSYAENTIDSLSAHDDSTFINFEMHGSFSDGAQSHMRFFIDSDNNSATGFSNRYVSGADYLVKDNRFYKFNDNRWEKRSNTINVVKQNNYISAEIPLQSIDARNIVRFTAVVTDSDWGNWKKYDGMVVYTFLSSMPPEVSLAPYNLEKFHNILQRSKLQWPGTGTTVGYNEFDGFYSDYFYLSREGNMTFEAADTGVKRVELRQGQNGQDGGWPTSTASLQRIVGEVKLFYPEAIKEYTWMQILAYQEGNRHIPVFRLVWMKNKDGYEDNLWLVIRDEEGGDSEWRRLMNRPDSFYKVEITVQNRQLSLYFDDSLEYETTLSYGDDFQAYFKAGVYLSGSVNNDVPEGQRNAKVQFKTLSF